AQNLVRRLCILSPPAILSKTKRTVENQILLGMASSSTRLVPDFCKNRTMRVDASNTKRVITVLASGWRSAFGGINAFKFDFCLSLGRVLK
ncbi:MAG TPA: hypothetical protein VG122_22765, partial [Gemmata sp.]|nr:hypothetical protein [Gemmata sp.]